MIQFDVAMEDFDPVRYDRSLVVSAVVSHKKRDLTTLRYKDYNLLFKSVGMARLRD